jgi:hypothetical protein
MSSFAEYPMALLCDKNTPYGGSAFGQMKALLQFEIDEIIVRHIKIVQS